MENQNVTAEEVKNMLETHTGDIKQLLADHATKMQQIMGSLFAHHTDVLDEMRGLVGKMDETHTGGEEARGKHLQAIVSLLEKHKADVLDGVHDAVDGFDNKPVYLSLHNENAKPKAQPEPEKKGLRRFFS